MDITNLTAIEISKKIKENELTVLEVVEAQFAMIEQRDPNYNCYITLTKEEAIQRAKEVQQGIEEGKYQDSPIAGVPIAIKDNMCTKGIKTTCASKILGEFIPPYDATVVKKLKDAGAIIIGKVEHG